MTVHNIGEVDEFPEGKGKKVQVKGIEFAVFNLDGELFGIQNMCPHKRLPLHITGEDRYYSRELIEDGTYCLTDDEKSDDEDIRGGINREELSINCPWHYLEFDLETGYNPVTDSHIATYDIEVKDDGTVWAEI